MSNVGGVGPACRVFDDRVEEGCNGTQAGTIFQFVRPQTGEWGGKELTGPGEQIEVEKRVAVGSLGDDFVVEDSGGLDLIA